MRVLNGTFTSSENSVARNRLRDLSIVTPNGVDHPDTTAWSDAGDTSLFVFRTRGPGTYVVGASTLPRTLRLDSKAFNEYLASDGVTDMLETRRRDGNLNKPSHERYSKHVKTLVQVGTSHDGRLDAVLGYPAEIVALDNPYSLEPGDTLRVRALVDGRPVANQLVIAGGRTSTGARVPAQNLRTNGDGIARVALKTRAFWYVKFIHMVSVQNDSVTYESKWATLTFQVR